MTKALISLPLKDDPMDDFRDFERACKEYSKTELGLSDEEDEWDDDEEPAPDGEREP